MKTRDVIGLEVPELSLLFRKKLISFPHSLITYNYSHGPIADLLEPNEDFT